MMVFGAIMPHPPIVVEEVGGKKIEECKKTVDALKAVAQKMKGIEFDTLVITTPHGDVARDLVPVYTSAQFSGNFLYFGAPEAAITATGDPELGKAVVGESKKAKVDSIECREKNLDHGLMVPLNYPWKAGVNKPILPIAIGMLPLPELFKFGKALAKASDNLGRKIALIGSADMSHRLTPDAPAGYDPAGKEFDDKLVDLVKNYDVQGILDFDEELAERAGQDALWSIAILLGALDGLKVKHEVLSYEGPFGVGYMVAAFEVKE